MLAQFVAATRRAEIVALINSAHSESELGSIVASELCEAYEAEIGFVLVAGTAGAELIGSVGLLDDDPDVVLAHPTCWKALSGAAPVTERGTDLLGLGICELALAPRTAGAARMLVGVGRLYEQRFEDIEVALLEAVAKSAAQALERFGLERQLQQAQEMEAVARMAGGIAQEFNSALATIIERCDHGLRHATAAETELREIRAAATSATEIAQYLLAFSRQPSLQSAALELNGLEPRPAADLQGLPAHELESLANLFRRLAHPIRLRILLALGSGTLSPSELEQQLEVKLGLVAYHVRDLRDDGVLTLVHRRAARGSVESFYRLTERGELARAVLASTWREMGDSVEHA